MDLADRLRAKAETTVGELAAEMGVSVRTIHRDLAMLRARGSPITGQAGPGGGIRLEGPRGVTSVHLSVGEVVTLWLAARLSQASNELPWSSRTQSALAKLLGSLPRQRARDLRDLCRRVFIGPAASPAVHSQAGRPPRELLRVFEEALSANVALGLAYRDRGGRESLRRIEPHGLLVQSPVWYILARDLDTGLPRMFRMDRISEPRLLRAVPFVPDITVARALLEPGIHWEPLLVR